MLLVTLPCVFTLSGIACRSGGKEPAKENSLTVQATGPKEPEIIWNDVCSTCHFKDRLSGVTAQDIHRALKSVSVMSGYADTLSDQEIQGLAAFLSGNPHTGGDYEFMASSTCGSCHDTHLAQWKPSMHAIAHFEPLYDAYFIKASQDSGKELEPFCAQCHTPIGVFNKEIPFPQPLRSIGDTKVSDIANDGVQCDFCHIIKELKPGKPGNANYVVDKSIVKRGPFKDAVSSFHQTAYSELHKKAEICGSCHDVTHPGNGLELETTYSEWENGPYAAQGVVCQDCHMTRGLTGFEASPGKAALNGPDRDHVSTHYFVGPNLLFKNSSDAAELLALSQELLRKAATVSIPEVKTTASGICPTIEVANTGAGHSIPTGVTEIRQMWLEIVATDDKGNVHFHSGALDEEGNIVQDPEPIMYYTWVKNAAGEYTTQFWNAVEKTRDHRIAPGQSVKESLCITTGRTKTLSVKLQYRSVSPAGLKEVNASGTLEAIPVFTMAEYEKEF